LNSVYYLKKNTLIIIIINSARHGILYNAFNFADLHKRKYKWEKLGISLQRALQAVPKPAIAILFIAAISQNLVLSNQSFLSPLLSLLPKELAVFLVPFFGALGSFAAGSATVFNLLFGQEINFVANMLFP
jgi:L-lactate permease